LVIIVIEFAQRPSTKEHQDFAVLNLALAAIKADNYVILFNKCPRGVNTTEARRFYEICTSKIS